MVVLHVFEGDVVPLDLVARAVKVTVIHLPFRDVRHFNHSSRIYTKRGILQTSDSAGLS